MLFFIIKMLLSASIIAFCSWLAGQRPVLAGFLTAIPLVSILALSWAYFEQRDMNEVNTYAVSILTAVPLSLTFFIPFVLNRWFKLGFLASMAVGLFLLIASYFIHGAVLRGRP